MDLLAKVAANQSMLSPVQRPVYSTTKLGLYTQNDIYVGNIHKYIQYIMTAKPMINYLLKKNKWTFDQLQQIQWNDIESALNSYKPTNSYK